MSARRDAGSGDGGLPGAVVTGGDIVVPGRGTVVPGGDTIATGGAVVPHGGAVVPGGDTGGPGDVVLDGSGRQPSDAHLPADERPPSNERPPADDRLLLLAQDAAEVPLISALMQDATVLGGDIAYDARARRLVLLANRYRWEAGTPTRVRAALRIEGVLRVQRRGWSAVGADAVLDLLALTVADAALTLSFAAGPTIRVEIECVELLLEDIGRPHAAARTPAHR